MPGKKRFAETGCATRIWRKGDVFLAGSSSQADSVTWIGTLSCLSVCQSVDDANTRVTPVEETAAFTEIRCDVALGWNQPSSLEAIVHLLDGRRASQVS
jgi:hypothetical protein